MSDSAETRMTDRAETGKAHGSRSKAAGALPQHLCLGITREGLVQFLQRLHFYDLLSAEQGDPSQPTNLSSYGRYDATYERPEALSWVTESFGPFNPHANPFLGEEHHCTGYDLCWVIRRWLADRGQEHLLVNEVLLAEGSPHVGKADVFWSHMQQKGVDSTLRCMHNACRDHAAQLPATPRFWLEYVHGDRMRAPQRLRRCAHRPSDHPHTKPSLDTTV
jgi:hypothetical protein